MSYKSRLFPDPIVSIFLEGRLWFDKSGGNTYHSVRIWVNGEILGCSGMEYGYDNQYQYASIARLVEMEILPPEVLGLPSWRIKNIYGIHMYATAEYGKKSNMWRNSFEEILPPTEREGN